jgi:hypothetical protein
MYISTGCAAFFVFAVYGAGMMTMAILLAGKEPEPKLKEEPTKVIPIAEDIEGSLIYPNVPDWKKANAN